MDVDEDRRDVSVVVVATRLLALSPMDLRASRHDDEEEKEDLLPPLLFTAMLLLALLLLLLLIP